MSPADACFLRHCPCPLQSFGPESCPFTAAGNKFWFAWVLPWWTVLIFTAVVYLDAATRTLPCYSLAVQMGSEFKHREWQGLTVGRPVHDPSAIAHVRTLGIHEPAAAAI